MIKKDSIDIANVADIFTVDSPHRVRNKPLKMMSIRYRI
jgi:hypothetical protein